MIDQEASINSLRRATLLICLFTFFSMLGAAEPIPLYAKSGVAYVEVTLENETGKSLDCLLMLDTGADDLYLETAKLPLSDWQAKEIPPIPVSTMYGEVTNVKTLEIPRVQIGTRHFDKVLAYDLGHHYSPGSLTISGRGEIPIVGTVGAKILFSESLSLCLARGYMEWTDDPGWKYDRQVPLVPLPYKHTVWAVWGKPFPEEKEERFVVDTGAFVDAIDQSDLSAKQHLSPRSWLQVDYLNGYSQSFGYISWPHPLDPTFVGMRKIAGLSTPIFRALGFSSLASYDLFFDLKNPWQETLWVRKLPQDLDRQFQAAMDDRGDFFDRSRHGIYGSNTGLVTRVFKYGDGASFVPNLRLGDIIMTINGIPWSGELPITDAPMVVQWRHPDGSTVTATVPLLPVFDKQ